MHSLPVHEQYIEHSSVLLAFYDSSVIEDRKIGSVSLSKVKVHGLNLKKYQEPAG